MDVIFLGDRRYSRRQEREIERGEKEEKKEKSVRIAFQTPIKLGYTYYLEYIPALQ